MLSVRSGTAWLRHDLRQGSRGAESLAPARLFPSLVPRQTPLVFDVLAVKITARQGAHGAVHRVTARGRIALTKDSVLQSLTPSCSDSASTPDTSRCFG